MKKIMVYMAAMLAMGTAMAQHQYQSVLDLVEQNSPMLKALKAKCEAEKAAVSGTAMLESPEVEFGYYAGSPSEVGNRWDLSASQSFDMPSVYVNRGKLRKLQKNGAEIEYQEARVELMQEVQMVCSELVYQKQVVKVLDRCAENAREIAQNYEKRLANGDCGILEYNRAKMECAEAENKLAMANLDREMLENRLMILNGGQRVKFPFEEFAEKDLPENMDSYCTELVAQSPAMKKLYNDWQSSCSETRLAKSERLPRMTLGYASENVVGETFRGVKAGVEIPLWNTNRGVKAAKANEQAAQAVFDKSMQECALVISNLYSKAVCMKQSVARLKEAYGTCSSLDLLKKSLDAGQISLEEYLLEMDFYIDSEIAILDAQKSLDQALIELNSVLL